MVESTRGKVIVITGASSGIGLAAAHTLARRGAQLVLAARSEAALSEAVAVCEQLGGRAIAVPTDVSDAQAVQHLARRALDTFGRIDVWINDAGVYLVGKFEDVPDEDFRQVFETNFFGVVNGVRAVWDHFKRQRQGILINVASVAADASMAYTSAYSSSKAAVRVFSDCLRMELHLDEPHDIHVCTVLPAAIDTPLFEHAGDFEGRGAKPPSPVYPVEEAARVIAKLVQHPQREVTVGRATPAMIGFKRLAPDTYERVMANRGRRDQFTDRPQRPTSGNLFAPCDEVAETHGGWLDDRDSHGVSTGTAVLLGLAAVAAVPALVAYARR